MAKHSHNFKDISGQKFGRLTAVDFVKLNNQKIKWNCICDCGNKVQNYGDALRRGKVVSCGCYMKENRSKGLHRTHGYAPRGNVSRTYRAWASMCRRCDTPSSSNYARYGGRGIYVCNRWLKFENFLQDMGEVPDGYSLDRIDCNGHYSKENCRWATIIEQANNKNNSVLITVDGQTLSAAQWSKKLGIKAGTIRSRKKKGWSDEEIIKTPILKGSQSIDRFR